MPIWLTQFCIILPLARKELIWTKQRHKNSLYHDLLASSDNSWSGSTLLDNRGKSIYGHEAIFTFLKQAFNESLDFLQPFIVSWMSKNWLTVANLTSNSFARSDTGVVIDCEPHLSRTCKSSLFYSPLAAVSTLAVSLFRFTLQQNR